MTKEIIHEKNVSDAKHLAPTMNHTTAVSSKANDSVITTEVITVGVTLAGVTTDEVILAEAITTAEDLANAPSMKTMNRATANNRATGSVMKAGAARWISFA